MRYIKRAIVSAVAVVVGLILPTDVWPAPAIATLRARTEPVRIQALVPRLDNPNMLQPGGAPVQRVDAAKLGPTEAARPIAEQTLFGIRVERPSRIDAIADTVMDGGITWDSLRSLEGLSGGTQIWDNYAKSYNAIVGFDGGIRHLSSRVSRMLPLQGRLVDIGGGVGIFTKDLAYRHPYRDIWLVDSSEQMLRQAKENLRPLGNPRHGRVHLVQRDIREFRARSRFDGAIMNNVLYTFPIENRVGILKQVHRALKPGGMLVLGDPRPTNKDPVVLRRAIKTIAHSALAHGSPMTDTELAFIALANKEVLVRQNLFLNASSLAALAREAGFQVVRRMSGYHGLETVLLLAKKARAASVRHSYGLDRRTRKVGPPIAD